MPGDPQIPSVPTSQEATSDAPAERLSILRREVADAGRLMRFAVATGRPVRKETLQEIKRAEDWEPSTFESFERRMPFEEAYRDLAHLMAPITATTLRDTEEGEDGRPSPARRWSWLLWRYGIAAAVLILVSENLSGLLAEFFPADVETLATSFLWTVVSRILESLEPFAYGALGAVAFLLRTAHGYIHDRSFDMGRKAEYSNRLFLGLIAGGAIKLFITQVAGDNGETMELSGAAMAFIAGYNSDFLFNTIERLVAAILPKVGLDSIARGEPSRARMATLERLLASLGQEEDPETKKKIAEVIDDLVRPKRS